MKKERQGRRGNEVRGGEEGGRKEEKRKDRREKGGGGWKVLPDALLVEINLLRCCVCVFAQCVPPARRCTGIYHFHSLHDHLSCGVSECRVYVCVARCDLSSFLLLFSKPAACHLPLPLLYLVYPFHSWWLV
jgi:hypothetical protein